MGILEEYANAHDCAFVCMFASSLTVVLACVLLTAWPWSWCWCW